MAIQTIFDSRENNIDFIRFFLALVVVFSHSFLLSTGSNNREPFMILTRGEYSLGSVAVDSFFILSGFLVTKSFLSSRSVFKYMTNRIRRIYPGFVVAMLFCVVVVVPLSGAILPHGSLTTFLGFLFSTLRLQEFGYEHAFASNPWPGSIDGPAWTIPYEFWCYIGIALLGVMGFLAKPKLVQMFFWGALGVALTFQITGWHSGGGFIGKVLGVPPMWARFLPMYLSGTAFFLYRGHIKHRPTWALAALTCLALATLIPHAWSICFPLAGCYLLLWFAYKPIQFLAHFGRIGDFSYGIYLYAWPVEQLVTRYVGMELNPLTLFSLACPITFVLAGLSWFLVERSCLRRRPRGLAEGRNVAPAGDPLSIATPENAMKESASISSRRRSKPAGSSAGSKHGSPAIRASLPKRRRSLKAGSLRP
jgi:peptidoglycan/LPS O-acetylase OafA/YrhL